MSDDAKGERILYESIIAEARDRIELLEAEVKRLRAALKMIARQEYDRGYSPEDFAEAVLSGDEPAAGGMSEHAAQ